MAIGFPGFGLVVFRIWKLGILGVENPMKRGVARALGLEAIAL